MKIELVKLYNGIKNDFSIQRHSLNWAGIISIINNDKRYKKPIEKMDIEFENKLLKDAINVTPNGRLKRQMESFARELSINIKTDIKWN